MTRFERSIAELYRRCICNHRLGDHGLTPDTYMQCFSCGCWGFETPSVEGPEDRTQRAIVHVPVPAEIELPESLTELME